MIPIGELYLHEGRTSLQPGEIVTEIMIDNPLPRQKFYKHSLRRSFDFGQCIIGAAADIGEDGICRDFCFALGAMAPWPIQDPEICGMITGRTLASVDLEGIASALQKQLAPPDEAMCPAGYKRQLAPRLLVRVIESLFQDGPA